MEKKWTKMEKKATYDRDNGENGEQERSMKKYEVKKNNWEKGKKEKILRKKRRRKSCG